MDKFVRNWTLVEKNIVTRGQQILKSEAAKIILQNIAEAESNYGNEFSK